MKYGLPYQGSKNSIVDWVISNIPKSENFYDLFCGGCAVTHGALLSDKFVNVYANDINPFSTLFIDAIKGKYRNENRWISRSDFENMKESDAYVAMCWSFGNDCRSYLFSPENERLKKAFWYAVMFNDYSLADELNLPLKRTDAVDKRKRRVEIMQSWKKSNKSKIIDRMELQSLERLERLQSLERLERLQSLESLERLQSLESLESLERLQSLERLPEFSMSIGNYYDVKIKQNSILYCDIPYRQTKKYSCGGFDYDRFYSWCEQQSELVMVSEYNMPDIFIRVASVGKQGTMCANSSKKVIEGLFVPKSQKALYEERKGKIYKQLSLFD